MNVPIDELYFEWLYSQVGDTQATNPSRTYWCMFRLLFTKEFVWIVPNDENRLEDGKDLRQEFVDELNLRNVDQVWMNLGCSVLEMLVALSRRLAFEGEGESSSWFWIMIENLGLNRYNDRKKSRSRQFPEQEIHEIVERLIWRNYDHDGNGGLFPLRNPQDDQRKVEIWYQLCSYIVERSYPT